MGPGARGNKAGVREYVVGASVLTPGIGGTVKPESTKSGLMRFNMSHEESAKRSPKRAFNMRPFASPNKLVFPADPTYSTPPIISITSARITAALNKNQKSSAAYRENPVSTGTSALPPGRGANSLYVVSAFASKLTCKNKTNTNTPIKLTVLLHIHAK